MNALNIMLGIGLYLFSTAQVSAAKINVNPLGEMTILPIENLCEVNVSTPKIDYGTRTSGQLKSINSGQQLSLGKRTLTLNVACPFNQVMQVVLRSSRSHDGLLQFGDYGSMSLKVLGAEVDGKPTQLTLIKDGIHKRSASDSLELRPDFGMMATREGKAVKGKTFTAKLEIEAVMAEKEARVSSQQVSEANLTLELIK